MKAAVATVAAVALASGVDAKVKRCPALEKGKKASLLRKAMSVKTTNPGVGSDLEKIKSTMDQVYKDGYYHVACVNDGMRMHADKHTLKGQRSYAAQNLDISIVWYGEKGGVGPAKEDEEEMTHSVCYNFCRRVEGMNYFGLQNGRDCYCTPYYKQEVGAGSEDCDMPCDGNNAILCGGKTKSDIFQMHHCGDVDKNLVSALELSASVTADLDEQNSALVGCADTVQDAGVALQQTAAKNGDKFLGGHAQNAKIIAGSYKKLTRSADKTRGAATEAEMRASALKTSDLTTPENAKAAEDSIDELDLAEANTADALDEVTKALGDCQATSSDDVSKKLDQYFNVAKWTMPSGNNAKLDVKGTSTSCAGATIGAPSNRTPAECAALCDATANGAKKCVGFQSYENTCVLFSSITEVSYYSEKDCAKADDAVCQLKMSEAVGFKPKDGVLNQARCFY